MGKKKSKNIKILQRRVEEEATDCFIEYNVEFDFHGYDGDVETIYVKEHLHSPNSVEFHMLETLQERVQKINPRYRVGILYTEKITNTEDSYEF